MTISSPIWVNFKPTEKLNYFLISRSIFTFNLGRMYLYLRSTFDLLWVLMSLQWAPHVISRHKRKHAYFSNFLYPEETLALICWKIAEDNIMALMIIGSLLKKPCSSSAHDNVKKNAWNSLNLFTFISHNHFKVCVIIFAEKGLRL